jgi:hypothetical protein
LESIFAEPLGARDAAAELWAEGVAEPEGLGEDVSLQPPRKKMTLATRAAIVTSVILLELIFFNTAVFLRLVTAGYCQLRGRKDQETICCDPK